MTVVAPAPAGDGGPRASRERRTVLRPQFVVTVAAALVAVLLAVFAYVLASSQATSRHEAERRFAGQATIAAALTEAIFTAVDGPEAQDAAKKYGGATVSRRAMAALARSSKLAYAVVVDGDGRRLAASPGAPTAGIGTAVRHALAGEPWLSDLQSASGRGYLIEQAIPFPTRFGRRVVILAYPASLLTDFLGSYLVGALPGGREHGFIIDGAHRIVASSVRTVAIGRQITNTQFLRALAVAGGGYQTHTGARYVVVAPITGSAWRIAITDPTSSLYPAVVGSEAWVLWAVFAAFALAAITGLYLFRRTLVGAAQMVTQARVVEEVNLALSAANAELDAFGYSVSHDLRAPLRAIDGFSLIVLEDDTGQLTEAQRRYLRLVRENTQTMGNLIDDLLAFSRLSNQPLERHEVDVGKLVAEVESELVAGRAGGAAEFTTGDLPRVKADPGLLRLVFVNLIDNALKYSREREPALVTVGSERHDGELVYFVRDNGVGFDMRYQEKLFQVFQRLHRAEDYAGTGVGLAIVHRIVTRHGGRVWADGKVGAGATFYFTLTKGGQ